MKKKNTLKIGAACDLGVHVDGAHLGPIKLLSKEDLILIQDDIEKAFAQNFDAFVHLAAFKAAGESMINPEKYSVNNITGTLNIMNAAVKYGCKNTHYL